MGGYTIHQSYYKQFQITNYSILYPISSVTRVAECQRKVDRLRQKYIKLDI